MNRFCVIGDSTNKPRYSSHIIVSSLNEAAKKLGFYDENGIQVKWDALCQTHGDKVDAYISSYELAFPELLIKNSSNKPLLGVSSDNHRFILEGGKPSELAGWFPLGVDSQSWGIVPKSKDLDKFCVGVYTESLVRGGVELCVHSFANAFIGKKNCVLKIKDRNATDKFIEHIKNTCKHYNIELEYYNDHWTVEQVKDFLSGIDCQLYLNRSSTWALPPIELMSAGIPIIIIPYSGPKEYAEDKVNCLTVDYAIRPVGETLFNLIDIGCRNYFLLDGYNTEPTWAVADIYSTGEKLLTLYENKDNICQSLSANAIKIGDKFSWENSVIKLKEQLDRWYD